MHINYYLLITTKPINEHKIYYNVYLLYSFRATKLPTPSAVLHKFINISFIKLFEAAAIKMHFISLCIFINCLCGKKITVFNFSIRFFPFVLNCGLNHSSSNDRPKTRQWENWWRSPVVWLLAKLDWCFSTLIYLIMKFADFYFSMKYE